jgi:hypothetical protein
MKASSMRVRLMRTPSTRRSSRGAHAATRPAPEAPAPEARAASAEDHPQERRARESGGPIDNAQYNCECGLVFDAAVSTSVQCPHCGTAQAW